MNRLKQTLGELSQFEQMLTWQDIQERLRSTLPADQYAAVLTTGCVRLDLVLYPGELGTELGYDLYVKDRPDGEEWVCYDSLPDDVRLDMDGVEREMAGVLDREVQRRGLSYTKCPFERVEGKTRVAKKPEMAEPQMGM